MKELIPLFLCLLPIGCGLFEKEFVYLETNRDIPQESDASILKHLESLVDSYLDRPSIHRIYLKKRSEHYLQEIYRRIARNAQFLLPPEKKLKYYIIREKKPFIFSLPNGHIFLSSGLLLDHLKNENILIAALLFEYIKSLRGIYQRREVIPTGDINTPHMVALSRIHLKVKMEINKWSYILMKKAQYDPEAILLWIQMQNRNILDFFLMNSSSRNISREELLFKNFLVGKEKSSEKKISWGNSSEDFYYLINDIKGMINEN